MAAYREHITVSGMLGAGVGLVSTFAFGFTPVQGILAGWLTAIGGILPDLDSESGRPVREMFGLTASVLPLLLLGRVLRWTGMPNEPESIMVLFLAMYLLIKYGLASLVASFSVHRGMFHSIPALIIASEAAWLAYPSDNPRVKLLMAGGIGVGFLSHLLLDEIYSVQWSGVRITLKKSAGSALKFFGKGFSGNATAYVLLVCLTLLTLTEAGIIARPEESLLRASETPLQLSPLAVEPVLGEVMPITTELPASPPHGTPLAPQRTPVIGTSDQPPENGALR